MNKIYTFTNWGDKVNAIDYQGRERQGVITEFDTVCYEDTKVVYSNGGFDWFNRDELELSSEARERMLVDLEKEKRG